MNIGLIDVDCHGEKKKWGATIYPNLALCKISAWHKSQGHTVSWATVFEHYDILYMSKIFNFSPDDLTIYNADKIVRGGTGYDLQSRLPDCIDRMQPDYSIYPNVPPHVIVYLIYDYAPAAAAAFLFSAPSVRPARFYLYGILISYFFYTGNMPPARAAAGSSRAVTKSGYFCFLPRTRRAKGSGSPLPTTAKAGVHMSAVYAPSALSALCKT